MNINSSPIVQGWAGLGGKRVWKKDITPESKFETRTWVSDWWMVLTAWFGATASKCPSFLIPRRSFGAFFSDLSPVLRLLRVWTGVCVQERRRHQCLTVAIQTPGLLEELQTVCQPLFMHSWEPMWSKLSLFPPLLSYAKMSGCHFYEQHVLKMKFKLNLQQQPACSSLCPDGNIRSF